MIVENRVFDRLAALGGEVQSPNVAAEMGFALGEAEATERVRRILGSDAARARPLAALRLATESSIAAEEAIAMLAQLEPEAGTKPNPRATGEPVCDGREHREGV